MQTFSPHEHGHLMNAEFGRDMVDDGLEVHQFDDTPLTIGSFCSFARGAKIVLGGEHRLDWVTTYPLSLVAKPQIEGHPMSRGPVVIGSDVWVGMDALILSGVTIGHGAVVAARAVVRSGTVIPDYAIVHGDPAKVLNYRFEKSETLSLLRIAWWDWPSERIVRAIPLMCQPDVWRFIRAVDTGEV